jgi:UDP-2,3-diacylglucosamine hydrolase
MRYAGATALPAFWELASPAAWSSIDFISDLHLGDDTPRTFDAFAGHLRHTNADAVFILGDLFEVWVGDDARQSGFEARVAEVLSDGAARRTVGFLPGNRDFLVGAALLKDCGLIALADPTVLLAFGERVMLSHGDALCLADVAYQRFRAQVRTDAWRDKFLAKPLVERRRLARQMRDASRQRQADADAGDIFDVDTGTAVRWMHEAGTPTMIHGHTHRPGSEAMAPGFIRHVLSDWDLDHGQRAEVLRWRRGGLARIAPASAGATA